MTVEIVFAVIAIVIFGGGIWLGSYISWDNGYIAGRAERLDDELDKARRLWDLEHVHRHGQVAEPRSELIDFEARGW